MKEANTTEDKKNSPGIELMVTGGLFGVMIGMGIGMNVGADLTKPILHEQEGRPDVVEVRQPARRKLYVRTDKGLVPTDEYVKRCDVSDPAAEKALIEKQAGYHK